MLLEFESRSDCVRLGHCFISNIAQLCPTVCNPMDGSLPGSFVHKIFQARVQEWVAISFSKGLVKDQVSGDSSVQLLSRVQLFVTPWTAARRASLSITNSQNLLKLMPIESVMPSIYLILCPPLLLPSLFPCMRVFFKESVLHIRWPEYWSFSFSISPSNKYSGLISFRIDWFDLPAFQGTLKGLLQYHSSKASILQHSASFIVQL